MPLANPAPNGRCTDGDYCTWADDQRWERIDGEAQAMAPATWRDEEVKRDLYQRAGVPEPWLVHPPDRRALT